MDSSGSYAELISTWQAVHLPMVICPPSTTLTSAISLGIGLIHKLQAWYPPDFLGVRCCKSRNAVTHHSRHTTHYKSHLVVGRAWWSTNLRCTRSLPELTALTKQRPVWKQRGSPAQFHRPWAAHGRLMLWSWTWVMNCDFVCVKYLIYHLVI